MSLMNVKIHWMKELAPRKHVLITPKIVITDLNEIKLMDYMQLRFNLKGKVFSAIEKLKRESL